MVLSGASYPLICNMFWEIVTVSIRVLQGPSLRIPKWQYFNFDSIVFLFTIKYLFEYFIDAIDITFHKLIFP